jgi:hypothetical protein
MMLRRKPLAALAAVTAAAAIAVPVASASAATPQPAAAQRQIITLMPTTPTGFLCSSLVLQGQGSMLGGNSILANLLGQTFQDLGCSTAV